MHTMSVRAAARRTALAAARRTALAPTVAALAATSIVAPTIAPASAMPVPSGVHLEAPAVLDTPRAHPRRVARQAELRQQREAELRAQRREERKAEQAAQSRGDQIIAVASQEAGDPYVYGAAGPDSFDCSGFTQYVFAQLGISLPHSSSAQAGMVQQVSDPQLGDLVFFTGSGGVYHVAIYAGDGTVWHAPSSGEVVSLEPIWTSSVFYGRVG
jgi:cell wall-associated NlpC family hydrolase